MDCLFCHIINKTLATEFVYEDDLVVAFNDIHPKAPIHQLIIPKKHIATINDLTNEDAQMIGRLYLTAKELAKQQGVADTGYRLVMNCNKHGGQEVYHLHLHFLAKRQMTWPPG